MNRVEVTIAPPSRKLSQNAPCTKLSKKRPGEISRCAAYGAAKAAINKAQKQGVTFPLKPLVRVSAVWYQGSRPGIDAYKPLDVFNGWGSLKWAIDGIVDAGLIAADSHDVLDSGSMTFLRTAKEHQGKSQVVLTFEEVGHERA